MKNLIKISIILSLSAITLSNCRNNNTLRSKNPYLYDILYLQDVPPYFYPTILPVKTIFTKLNDSIPRSIEYRKDSMYILYSNYSFHRELNIHIIDYESFCNKIFEKIVNKQFISIDTNLFKDLRKWGYVSEDPYIKQLYEQEGIAQVLNTYLNNQGWLTLYYINSKGEKEYYWGKNVNIEYIIYLASKYNIFFVKYSHYFDEPIGYYLNKYLSDTTQLKGLKPLEDPFPMEIKKPV